MPLLQDGEKRVPETSIIIDYLQAHHPGSATLIPSDGDAAREVRLWDRFFDLYVTRRCRSSWRIACDRRAPRTPRVEEARATLDTAYAMLDRRMAGAPGRRARLSRWRIAPPCRPLFYAEAVHPFRAAHPALAAYFERLIARPSSRRVIREAQPWFRYFPFVHALEPRFLAVRPA